VWFCLDSAFLHRRECANSCERITIKVRLTVRVIRLNECFCSRRNTWKGLAKTRNDYNCDWVITKPSRKVRTEVKVKNIITLQRTCVSIPLISRTPESKGQLGDREINWPVLSLVLFRTVKAWITFIDDDKLENSRILIGKRNLCLYCNKPV
jgi:hypothetical protein